MGRIPTRRKICKLFFSSSLLADWYVLHSSVLVEFVLQFISVDFSQYYRPNLTERGRHQILCADYPYMYVFGKCSEYRNAKNLNTCHFLELVCVKILARQQIVVAR
ncbi:uncharacterized protein PHALS_14632 [Plasmopara halstedii]|uniref:Uncharacterized protein n=1 Tax=Plasmopara halstedii TaxID=4781 RepID=A0A0N7L5V0_PLAHL|nr:uncharacterized protein PHALS_14632 [Plasmopara halstedii]CEG42491.1 hypothetical protein PHALS_14632 [Plasmopara halstedii]|eukprot:XP_024578860.1 hypothetical protein PHALS_14632 [Plasmopara halstedii]